MQQNRNKSLAAYLVFGVALFAMNGIAAHAKSPKSTKNSKIIHKAIKKGDCKQSDHCKVTNGKGESTTATTNDGSTTSSTSSYKQPEGKTKPGTNY